MGRRFQFNLKLPFILLAGMTAGGETAHRIAVAIAPMRGGVPVSFSARGHVIFFTVGSVAALVGMALARTAPSLLQIHSPWCIRNKFRRNAFLLIAALLIGSVSAAAALFVLACVFFAMPREIYDLLTT